MNSADEQVRSVEQQSRIVSTIAIVSSLMGVLWLGVSRVYYVLFHSPEFHGSWLAAMKRIVDFDGWWSYISSLPGIVFHGLALISFARNPLHLELAILLMNLSKAALIR